MRQISPGFFRQDKSTQSQNQKKQIYTAIAEALRERSQLKTPSQFAGESAKHFRKAFHLAYCAAQCWIAQQIENSPKLRHFFGLDVQGRSKHEDSCHQSDAKNEGLSNAEKVDECASFNEHQKSWRTSKNGGKSLPQSAEDGGHL
jgi:hypothetical protein